MTANASKRLENCALNRNGTGIEERSLEIDVLCVDVKRLSFK